MNDLARCFTFAETGELLGHLLDGHIIHLPSKPLWHNIEKDRVEKDRFELLPCNGIPLGTLQSPGSCKQDPSMRYGGYGPNRFEALLRWIPPVPD